MFKSNVFPATIKYASELVFNTMYFMMTTTIKYSLNFVFKAIYCILNSTIVLIILSIMALLPWIFSLIGLSSIGPIAGGVFASMQGSGIVAGSSMAILQSIAMNGCLILIHYIGVVGCSILSMFKFCTKIFYKNK